MAPDDDLQRELHERLLLHRRRFLGLLAGSAGAVVLGACTSDDGGEADGSPDGSDGGGGDGGSPTEPLEVPDATGIDADPFTLGVASGDPLPTFERNRYVSADFLGWVVPEDAPR